MVLLAETQDQLTALEQFFQKVIDWATTAGIKIVIALILWFIFFKLINFLNKRITKKLLKKKTDKTLTKVVNYVITVGLKILVVICLLGYVGIETTSISAVLASVGVGVGMALNGALSNFAGGLLIIVTRPFRVDDYIKALDEEGTVEDIHIIYTKLRTIDNRVIYLPNGSLSSASIVNYSEKEQRRLDMTFSVSYQADVNKAKGILNDICANHPLIIKDVKPFIRISNHNTSSIDICLKVWTKNEDYWDVYFDMLEEVKKRFDEENIEIPYNQLDVHIKND
ncbi:MAG: mechanosensitive ion channel protein MscS [Coprobacillus sp. 28_7]|nr:MAG: mechanosensitive ion channel protein MscS [Coprobacillus sp. 28_7]CCY08108.1 putative uncharacterized protein CPE0213 [Coprobacillus sp. CAG:698]